VPPGFREFPFLEDRNQVAVAVSTTRVSAPAPDLEPVPALLRGWWLVGGGALSVLLLGAATAVAPLAGLAVLLGVVLVVGTALRPDLGALGLIAVVPAVSGLRRGLPVPGLRLSEALIGVFATVVLVAARRRNWARWSTFDWVVLAYVAATIGFGGFDVLRRGDGLTGEAVGALVGPLQFLLLYRAVVTALPHPDQRRTGLRLLLLASLPLSLSAILQQAGVHSIRSAIAFGTGTDIYSSLYRHGFYGYETIVPRATAFFPHWQDLGGYLFLLLILCTALLLDRDSKVLRRRWLVPVAIATAVALGETVSLAPIASAILGAFLVGWWSGKARKVLLWGSVVLAGLAIVLAPLFTGRAQQQFGRPASAGKYSLVPQTIQYRYDLWRTQFIPLVERTLPTGYGPTLPPGLNFPHTESLYITMALRGGITLLTIYVLLVGALLAKAARRFSSDDADERAVARTVAAATVALIFGHLIATYFIDSGPAHVLWALVALLAVPRAYQPATTPAAISAAGAHAPGAPAPARP
jgi:hypothetical protein